MKWQDMYSFQRIEAVVRCGWRNKDNNATPTGKRIANTEWLNLTDCAKNVLINYGYQY